MRTFLLSQMERRCEYEKYGILLSASASRKFLPYAHFKHPNVKSSAMLLSCVNVWVVLRSTAVDKKKSPRNLNEYWLLYRNECSKSNSKLIYVLVTSETSEYGRNCNTKCLCFAKIYIQNISRSVRGVARMNRVELHYTQTHMFVCLFISILCTVVAKNAVKNRIARSKAMKKTKMIFGLTKLWKYVCAFGSFYCTSKNK